MTNAHTTIAEITPAQYLERRDRGEKLTLLDVREEWELKVASVPGIVHIPMGEVPNRVAELDRNTEIVVLCRSGRRSLEIAKFLHQQDFRTANLSGGILAWSHDIDPSIPAY
jgi:rhodanese-related sulfurtransferase